MGGDQTPLLRRRLVPALLLVVPATAAVSASTGIVQAVEECRLEPGWSAPSGSKWLSRINRDHHRCWFLSSRATGHHAQLPRARSVRNRHLAGDTEAARRDPRRDSDLQAASAPIGQTDVAVAAEPPAVLQSTTPPVGQSSANLTARSVPTIAYKVLPTLQTSLSADGWRCTYCRAGTSAGEHHQFASSCRSSRSRSVELCWRNDFTSHGKAGRGRALPHARPRAPPEGQPLLDHQSLRSGRP